MKKILVLIGFLISIHAIAGDTAKLYHPEANVEKDVAELLKKAKKENKNVMLQIGGNWCIWCYRFHDFVENDKELKEVLEKNYVVYHLNYSKENTNYSYLKKLGFPQRFGFPVFVILDKDGKEIHTQDSGLLEEGRNSTSYNKEKVKTFFQNWSTDALNEANYKE